MIQRNCQLTNRTTIQDIQMNSIYYCCNEIAFFLLFHWLVETRAWTSSSFIKFRFHRASELWVQTHSEFKFLSFFKFNLEFGYEFSNSWSKWFEYFKFYHIRLSLKPQTFALEFGWVSLKIEFLNSSSFRVSSSTSKH